MKKLSMLLVVGLVILGLTLPVFAGKNLVEMELRHSPGCWVLHVYYYTTHPPSEKIAQEALMQVFPIALDLIDTKTIAILGAVYWIDSSDMDHRIGKRWVVKKGTREVVPFTY